jgi:hypothetical protein
VHLEHGDILGRCPLTPAANVQNMITSIATEEVRVSPNPANGGVFKIELRNFKSTTADIYLVAPDGAPVSKKVVQLSAGSTVQSFNLKNNPAGMYYIKIVTATGVKTSKISIKP